MGRKRRDEDQRSEQDKAGREPGEANTAPEPEGRPRRARKLALLLALIGGAAYLVRRNQRKAQLDEGIWHEAPATPSSAASGPTTPASSPTA
jgi:hypothetical protein